MRLLSLLMARPSQTRLQRAGRNPNSAQLPRRRRRKDGQCLSCVRAAPVPSGRLYQPGPFWLSSYRLAIFAPGQQMSIARSPDCSDGLWRASKGDGKGRASMSALALMRTLVTVYAREGREGLGILDVFVTKEGCTLLRFAPSTQLRCSPLLRMQGERAHPGPNQIHGGGEGRDYLVRYCFPFLASWKAPCPVSVYLLPLSDTSCDMSRFTSL